MTPGARDREAVNQFRDHIIEGSPLDSRTDRGGELMWRILVICERATREETDTPVLPFHEADR